MRNTPSRRFLLALLFAGLLPAADALAQGAGRGRGNRGGPGTLLLDNGTLDFDTPDFNLKLVKESQTISALQPKGAQGYNNTPFDFTPADILATRSNDGFNHLGDITLRIQQQGWQEGAWVDVTSSGARKPVTALNDYKTPAGAKLLAASDLTPTLGGSRVAANAGGRGGGGRGPATPDINDLPVQVTRSWLVDASGRLVLHFDIRNKSNAPVQVGGLGIPLVFNNIITGKNLEQAHNINSFFDPYVGQDAGYLQVTRLNGAGPALVVTEEPGTKTPFEAFRPIGDGTPRTQTSEAIFEWTVYSGAYAANEWRNAKPWNPGTSVTIQPGQTISHGVRLLVSPQIRDIEKTLAANKRPVAVGLPGYIVPMDLNAKLFLDTQGRKVTGIETDPPNAITATANATTKGGWLDYNIKGNTWGRVRMTISYDDGTKQAVHYYVIKPAAEAVANLGNFMFTKQWFTKADDPFKRAPSIMTYDRANNRIVEQDTRVWVAGLGDEGGSSWVSGGMKLLGQPKPDEVAKYEEFIDKVLWGGLQLKEGPNKYGVLKSMFYYDASGANGYQYMQGNWGSWTSWTQQQVNDVFQRAYNYPHVVAAYWSMYQVARNNPGLTKVHDWKWYLDQAYQTTNFMLNPPRRMGYVNTGLMEGDIFVMLLKDLKREGMTQQAATIEAGMKRRADRWRQETFPFGSEMAWDSTGQEEVYAWTSYFGYQDKAEVTINSILGYMPTVPHWGYNGNARRYWDFQYGGAPGGGIERQLHHYGSGINAIPALAQYRQFPDDYYLLRIGYAGAMGALSNIDEEGFASAAFHSYPQNLRWDAYSGDYAQNFFGHAVNSATYIINHPEFGWQSFGGNVTAGATVSVKPLDSFRKRVYIAPFGLYLTLEAGTVETVEINPATKSVKLALSPKGQFTPDAVLRVEQPAKVAGVGTFAPTGTFKSDREALVVPLGPGATTVELVAK